MLGTLISNYLAKTDVICTVAPVSLAPLCRLKGNTTIAHMAVGVTSLKEFLVQNVFEDWTTMISKENWGFFPDQTAA